MGFLDLFGPSKADIWRQLSMEIGADYVDGGFLGTDRVEATHGQWTITLDTFTSTSGDTQEWHTRLRAPYVNPSQFRFTIYRAGLFSRLGGLVGMQDITIGDTAFDRDFIIQGTNVRQVCKLLEDQHLRDLIAAQPAIRLSVKDNEGWFGPTYPADTDMLHFEAFGEIKDLKRLRRLFDLFAETLDQLCHIGAAYRDKPHVAVSE